MEMHIRLTAQQRQELKRLKFGFILDHVYGHYNAKNDQNPSKDELINQIYSQWKETQKDLKQNYRLKLINGEIIVEEPNVY